MHLHKERSETGKVLGDKKAITKLFPLAMWPCQAAAEEDPGSPVET